MEDAGQPPEPGFALAHTMVPVKAEPGGEGHATASPSDDGKLRPTVKNVIGLFRLGQRINLRHLASHLRSADRPVEYEQLSKHPAVVIKFKAQTSEMQNVIATGMVFGTGKVLISGEDTEDRCREAAKKCPPSPASLAPPCLLLPSHL